MGEIRAAFQDFVTTVMSEVFASPITIVLLLTWAALMLIVGIITSMRWTARQFRRLQRRGSGPTTMQRWAATPLPPTPTRRPTAPPAHRAEPFPLRPAPGPRDW